MILKDWLDNKYTKEEQNNLIILSCSREGITSLEGIEGLVKLENLYCSDNKLKSLKGIEHLVNLYWLNCSNNYLTSLKDIEQLVNLKELHCFNNPLPYSDLWNLSNLKLELKREIRQDKIQKLLI